jgi:hypothetical protein
METIARTQAIPGKFATGGASDEEHVNSCVAGSVNNVGQDELLYARTGWLYSFDTEAAGRSAGRVCLSIAVSA